jgi:hypothetical protein
VPRGPSCGPTSSSKSTTCVNIIIN